MIEIRKVNTKKQTKAFIDFPHDLYEGDPNYVPEVYLGISEVLSKKKNPFFQHSKADLFLAYKGDKIVGRIAAIKDNNYNAHHNSNVGFFGFFDVIEDYEAAQALLDKACEWNKAEKTEAILGPTNFTTNDTAGLLIEGFDSPPLVQMTYCKPYYQHFLEQYGFAKEMDLFAYMIYSDKANEKSLRLAALIQERLKKRGIDFRNVDMKNFKSEAKKIKEVYRSAWEKNWGFVPPTDAEFDHLAEGLKMVIDGRYVYIAEHKGEMVGFAVALPDINEIMINVKRGRLFPTGIFKLLFGKKKVKKIRIILLGVVEDYRKMGIEAVFFANYIRAARENGLIGGEASWILENNEMMCKAAENLNGEKYKTYRIYSKKM